MLIKILNKDTMLSKLFTLLIISLLFLALSNVSEAKSASYNILKTSIGQVKSQNLELKQQLTAQAETTALQARQIQQLHTAMETQLNKETADPFLNIFRIITLFTLSLLLFTLYTLTTKYLPLLDRYKALLQKQHRTLELHHHKIDDVTLKTLKAQKITATIEQSLSQTKINTGQDIEYLKNDVETLQKAQKLTKDQAAIAIEVLDKHLKSPLETGLSEQNLGTLHALLDEGHLDFTSSIKAKALIAEHDEQWSEAIHYWDTVLLEKPKNNEALLHIGFANYKLAANHRKDQSHLNKAVATYDKIMVSAPEYFEDAYGFDDQTVGPDEIETNADELWIYQQVEELIIKTDELKNYHSVLNVACEYSVGGKIEDARECLEQVSTVYHASNCKQLREDKDLDSVREHEWFKKIIKDACEISSTKKESKPDDHSTKSIS